MGRPRGEFSPGQRGAKAASLECKLCTTCPGSHEPRAPLGEDLSSAARPEANAQSGTPRALEQPSVRDHDGNQPLFASR